LSEIFGEKLRNRRLEKGLTLETLATRVGSTKAYIWQLENKKPARPSGELLIKIANVLEISAEYLIDDSSPAPTSKHVGIALARGAHNRGLSQEDVDKLFKAYDIFNDGGASKKSKSDN
jgi:transcriptional regulator with XRE-family HTH domain